MANALHKFAAGDRVSFMPTKLDTNVRPGIYTIVRTLPVTTEGCQYRVKNSQDSHERVLNEAQLHAA
jgi:hypothetical protein